MPARRLRCTFWTAIYSSGYIGEDGMPENLTAETFRQKVFDYETNKEWSYQGELPCIVDFYADWCGPCRMVGPVLEQIARDYEGKLLVYKVNTDEEPGLAGAFGIQSVPSLLFVPRKGKPQMAAGALPRTSLERAIREVLEVEPPATN